MKEYALSPSTLNIFQNCPRCFWIHINKGKKRPRGIFPSLPGGMDSVIKKYFDKYRSEGKLPPEILGKVRGQLFRDHEKLTKWRSWRETDLVYRSESLNASLSGALDDCLIEDHYYIPLDYKTRGSDLIEDPRKYYQSQLDCYSLLLDSNGYKTNNLAYLVYYWPVEVGEHGNVKFHVEVIMIETNLESARKLFTDAVNCLLGKMPTASMNCEHCQFEEHRKLL